MTMAYGGSGAAGAGASHVLPSHAHQHHLNQQAYLGSPALAPAAVPAYNVHVLGGGGGGGAHGVAGTPAVAAPVVGLDGASFGSAGDGDVHGGGVGNNSSTGVYGGVSDGGAMPSGPRVSPTLSSAAPVFSMATAAATAPAPGLGQVIKKFEVSVVCWCANLASGEASFPAVFYVFVRSLLGS